MLYGNDTIINILEECLLRKPVGISKKIEITSKKFTNEKNNKEPIV
jgi:hypothetical protein